MSITPGAHDPSARFAGTSPRFASGGEEEVSNVSPPPIGA